MSAPFIIMGAHGGIGQALAGILLDRGDSVFATTRNAETAAQLAVHERLSVHPCDVTKADDIARVIAGADQGAGIAGLAYCIGSIDIKPFRSASEADFLKAFQLNVLGAVQALQAAEEGLKKAGGSVVLFSSIAVQQGFANHTVISSAKGAIEALTLSLAAEWAPKKVRVNCIAPSLTKTPLAQNFTSSETMVKSIADMHPLSRLGEAHDTASLAAFLLGQDSTWITGQVIRVDGGRSSLRPKG